MKKLIVATLLILFITGCKKEENVSNDFVYKHKFVQRDFLPIVPGTLNGSKVYFLLDTGASISILDLKESSRFGVKQGSIDDLQIGGYGGVTSNITKLENVDIRLGTEIMTQDFKGKDIQYLIKGISQNTGVSIVGIIGNNNISSSNLILDFETDNILKRIK